jgi:predicted acetylornithine/succinylornithine family transaminase
MTSDQVIEQFQQYVIANYKRFPVCLVRGEGSTVWDAEGQRYLDFFPGWGCGLLGHCPPRVVAAVREQIGSLIHVPNTWYTAPQGALAQALSKRADFAGKCFFCNSGTEANEAAIKLARLHGGPKRHTIICMTNSFHGRTMGALSATGQPKYHEGVGPLLPGFRFAPFGDLAAIEQLVDGATCAVMLEPIQGEGGVNLPPDGYLQGLRQLCDHHNLLLIVDEVQTGMGRTGRWYTHQHYGVKPDIVTLAKALGGGVAIGGLIATPAVSQKMKPGTHAATFGGNPLACRAALATIETIEANGLLDRALQLGQMFRERFLKLQTLCPMIKSIRVAGVMIGVELAADGTPIVEACLKRRLLINCTHQTVLRLLPAMNLTDAEFDEGMTIIEQVMTQ